MKHTHGGPRGGPFSLPLWSHRTAGAVAIAACAAADPSALAADTGDPGAAPAGGPSLPRLLSSADVGELFNRSVRTLRRWIRAGHLVPVRVGGALFFDPDDIRRLIAGRLRAAVPGRHGGGAEPAGGLLSADPKTSSNQR